MKRVILVIGNETYSVLSAVHAYSGCNTTSTFVGRRKIASQKLFGQHPEFVHTFAELGTSEELPKSVFIELEKFACVL